jgi:stage V sporulation protein G
MLIFMKLVRQKIYQEVLKVPTQKPTGARKPQTTGQQTEKQGQRLPSLKASINWLNPKDEGNTRATANLTIGGSFAVHGIKVTRGSKGEFVSMPSYKKGDEYKDIFHAVTADARQQMNDAVMKAYEQKLAEQNQSEEIAVDEQDETPADDPAEAEKGQVMGNM